jgi:hypothetical protein
VKLRLRLRLVLREALSSPAAQVPAEDAELLREAQEFIRIHSDGSAYAERMLPLLSRCVARVEQLSSELARERALRRQIECVAGERPIELCAALPPASAAAEGVPEGFCAGIEAAAKLIEANGTHHRECKLVAADCLGQLADDVRSLAATPPAPVQAGSEDRSRLIDSIVRDVAELPDRTSPDNRPDIMLVSDSELRDILHTRLAAQPHPPADSPALDTLKQRVEAQRAHPDWDQNFRRGWEDRGAMVLGAIDAVAASVPADRVREALQKLCEAAADMWLHSLASPQRARLSEARQRAVAILKELNNTPAQPNRETLARALADMMAPAQGGEGKRT